MENNYLQVNENKFKRGTYNLKQLVVNMEGHIDGYVYENDKLKIKTPMDQQAQEYEKIKKLQADQGEFEQLIKSECGKFYFNFYNGGLLSMDIKESIKARFLYLCTYTNYKDKGMYLTWDNGQKMDRKGMQEVLGLSEREFKSTIKAMLDNELLTKEGDYFLVNQSIATRGKLTTKQNNTGHTRVFDNGMRNIYQNCKATQHKQLYYLFRLLPYVNLKYNVVCQNPTEESKDAIIPLSLSEICEIVGYDISNAKRLERDLYNLQVYEKLVILGVQNAKGIWYKVNPRVYYGGTDGHLDVFIKLLATDFDISTAMTKRKRTKVDIAELKARLEGGNK